MNDNAYIGRSQLGVKNFKEMLTRLMVADEEIPHESIYCHSQG